MAVPATMRASIQMHDEADERDDAEAGEADAGAGTPANGRRIDAGDERVGTSRSSRAPQAASRGPPGAPGLLSATQASDRACGLAPGRQRRLHAAGDPLEHGVDGVAAEDGVGVEDDAVGRAPAAARPARRRDTRARARRWRPGTRDARSRAMAGPGAAADGDRRVLRVACTRSTM